MVTQAPNGFDDISFTFTHSGALRRAVDAATSKARREGKTSWADTLVFDAWLSLPDNEQRTAVQDLCTAYFLKLNEERRAHEHDALGTSGTYLEPDDLPLIHEALMNAAPIDEDTVIDGFLGDSIDRLLKELELLRYRLGIAQHENH
ncbi:hypothetical protein G6W61_27820 [Streptomyces sp. KAI-26]|uniref:hypothetical protein n=1 Tax=Streptomyces sp. KAI-26 TaxID=1169747 RepID=UPI0015871E3E|nr:hypothetical protein [Streptomyces sp. KAI-26]NUV89972.1 hypothetical protein [Streptomyces sp. KAI-26]NUW23986.1 hypothetical protein [Streptomyces roseoviolaceus]